MLRHRLKTCDLASRSERNAALIRTLSEASSSSSFIIEVVIRNFHIHITMVHSIQGSPQRIHQFTNIGSRRRHIVGHEKLWRAAPSSFMQQVSKGIIICNIQFTIGVLIHRTPERTGQPYIGVQYALNNIIFVLNDADANLRIIMLDLAYKDLVCFIMSASSDKVELISWPKYL